MPANLKEATDAVRDAFYASFGCPADEAINPDRRSIDAERFLGELNRLGWRVDVEFNLANPALDPDLFKVIEDADDEAFEEGSEDETPDGQPVSHRNTWSAERFIASCAADGVTFYKPVRSPVPPAELRAAVSAAKDRLSEAREASERATFDRDAAEIALLDAQGRLHEGDPLYDALHAALDESCLDTPWAQRDQFCTAADRFVIRLRARGFEIVARAA